MTQQGDPLRNRNPGHYWDPGQRPLHGPPRLPQARFVVDALLRQDRLDPQFPQPLPVWLRVVRQVPLEGVGPLPRAADLARHRRDLVEQRRELGDVITVGRRPAHGHGDARGVGQDVVLAARLAPIHGAGASGPAAVGRADRGAIDQRPRPIDLVGPAEPGQQDSVDPVPGAVGLPVAQASPAGHARAAAHLARQVLPGDASFQDEEDARQGVAVADGGASPLGARRRPGRQERADDFPEFVGQDGLGHGRNLPVTRIEETTSDRHAEDRQRWRFC